MAGTGCLKLGKSAFDIFLASGPCGDLIRARAATILTPTKGSAPPVEPTIEEAAAAEDAVAAAAEPAAAEPAAGEHGHGAAAGGHGHGCVALCSRPLRG